VQRPQYAFEGLSVTAMILGGATASAAALLSFEESSGLLRELAGAEVIPG
jgi:hypothetical protein